MGKTTNFKFCTHINIIDRNKSPLKISAEVAVGVLRDSKIFRAPICKAHRAVIFLVLDNFASLCIVNIILMC